MGGRKRTSLGRVADEPQREWPRGDEVACEDSKRSARGGVGLSDMGRECEAMGSGAQRPKPSGTDDPIS